MVLGEVTGATRCMASERMQILSGGDGTRDGFKAGSSRVSLRRKRKFRSCSLDQSKMVQ